MTRGGVAQQAALGICFFRKKHAWFEGVPFKLHQQGRTAGSPMTCVDFEVAIQKSIHGALSEPEERALRAHVSGCPACQRFEDNSKQLEAAMTIATATERHRDELRRRI